MASLRGYESVSGGQALDSFKISQGALQIALPGANACAYTQWLCSERVVRLGVGVAQGRPADQLNGIHERARLHQRLGVCTKRYRDRTGMQSIHELDCGAGICLGCRNLPTAQEDNRAVVRGPGKPQRRAAQAGVLDLVGPDLRAPHQVGRPIAAQPLRS